MTQFVAHENAGMDGQLTPEEADYKRNRIKSIFRKGALFVSTLSLIFFSFFQYFMVFCS